MKKDMIKSKTKYIITILTVVLSVCLFSGCSDVQDSNTPEKDLIINDDSRAYVYCTDLNVTGLYREVYNFQSEKEEQKLVELMKMLDMVPETAAYKKAKPSEVKIEFYEIGQDGQLIIYFSPEYYKMDRLQEVICRSAFVKTLCQLKNIDYVEFYVGGQPMLVDDQPTGQMTAEDFVDKTGIYTDFRQKVRMNIFLANSTGDWFEESVLMVESDGTKSMEQLVLEQLINGPLENQTELYPAVNPRTVVNKVHTSGGVCYVDFSKEFLEKLDNVTPEVTVYSVVNSLCELPNVHRVRITINGDGRKSIGNISFDRYLQDETDEFNFEEGDGN